MDKTDRLIATGVVLLLVTGWVVWDFMVSPGRAAESVIHLFCGYALGSVLGWLWSYNPQLRDERGRFVKSRF